MRIIITENQLKSVITEIKNDSVDVRKSIKYLRGVSNELKDVALNHLQQYTKAKKGRVSGLTLHSDLIKKIKEKDLPNGFDMGIDKDGYYIHTHRARSKSHPKPDGVTVKEIKFVNSTG